MRKFFSFLLMVSLVVSLLFLNSCDAGVKDICKDVDALNPNEYLAVLGDSILVFHHEKCYTVPGLLSLELKQKIKSYAKDGSFITGVTPLTKKNDIFAQYAKARKELPKLNTILLDGGGMDFLVDCVGDDTFPVCKDAMEGAIEELQKLLLKIQQDGIQVLFIGYYHPIVVFSIFKDTVDDAMNKVKEICDTMSIKFYDTRSLYDKNKSYYWADGIHPSAKGTKGIVTLLMSGGL